LKDGSPPRARVTRPSILQSSVQCRIWRDELPRVRR
jgi:hypothetical protein